MSLRQRATARGPWSAPQGRERAEAAPAASRLVTAPDLRVMLGGGRPCGPASAPRAGAATRPALNGPTSDALLEGRVALVVDDEPMILEIMAEHCASLGMRVFDAADGEDALGVVASHPEIEVLVTDVRMPGLDGPGLVERTLSMRPDVKVIFVTGYTTYRSSAWPILRKPFDLDDLEAALRQVLVR